MASGRDGRGSGCAAIQASILPKRPLSMRARTSSLSTAGRPRREFLRASIDMPNLYAHLMRAARGVQPSNRPNPTAKREFEHANTQPWLDTGVAPAGGSRGRLKTHCLIPQHQQLRRHCGADPPARMAQAIFPIGLRRCLFRRWAPLFVRINSLFGFLGNSYDKLPNSR